MKYLYVAFFIFFISACSTPYQATTNSTRLQYHYDAGILATSIKNLTVGMSPRRVLEEFNLQNWKYGSLSSITLEDMIERGIRDGNLYLSTKNNTQADLEVFFQDSRVIFIRENYSISGDELEQAISKARNNLSRLGKVSESKKDNEIKIIYQPFKLSYAYYKFYKLVENQKNYNVSFVVANVKS